MPVHSRVGPVLVKRSIPEIWLPSEGLRVTIPLLRTAIRQALSEDLRVTWQEVGRNFHTRLRRSGFSTRYLLLAQHHRELPVPAVAALSHGREPGPSHTDWTRLFPQAGILGTGSSRTCTPLKMFLPHCQALAWLLPPLWDLHSPKERRLLAKHWQVKRWANISALPCGRRA